MEGEGDLVSILTIPISHVITPVKPIVNPLTKFPGPPSTQSEPVKSRPGAVEASDRQRRQQEEEHGEKDMVLCGLKDLRAFFRILLVTCMTYWVAGTNPYLVDMGISQK